MGLLELHGLGGGDDCVHHGLDGYGQCGFRPCLSVRGHGSDSCDHCERGGGDLGGAGHCCGRGYGHCDDRYCADVCGRHDVRCCADVCGQYVDVM